MFRVRLSGWRLASAPPKRPGCPAGSRWRRKQKQGNVRRMADKFMNGDLDEVGWLLHCGEGEERRPVRFFMLRLTDFHFRGVARLESCRVGSTLPVSCERGFQ